MKSPAATGPLSKILNRFYEPNPQFGDLTITNRGAAGENVKKAQTGTGELKEVFIINQIGQ